MSAQNNSKNQSQEGVSDEIAQRSYLRLTFEGQQKYKEIQNNSVKSFFFWAFVGNIGGFAISSALPYMPFSEDAKKNKMRRYQRYTFLISLFAFSYHGYKLSKRDFLRSKKKLLANPDYILQEPNDFPGKDEQ